MDKQHQKELAKQLRQPEGEYGIKVGEEMNKGNKVISLKAYELLNINNGDNILEIGPGNAAFIQKELFNKYPDIHYIGADISKTMLEQATILNQNLVDSGKGKFVEANITKMPFEDNSFDRICTVNTFYFWGNHQAAINEIRRVLKPGGIAIIAVRPKQLMDSIPFTDYGFNAMPREAMLELFNKVAWKSIEVIEHFEGTTKFAGMEMEISGEYYLLTK